MGASLAIGVILSLAGASPAGGQTADGSAEARGVAQAVTAAELAAWGRAHRDPGALIMAARLTDEINMRQGPDSDAGPLLSAETLLDEAAAMAPDDAPVQAAVAHLRDGPARRGVRASPIRRGPIYTVNALRAGQIYPYDLDARSGEILRVAAIGDGDTDIDLSVRDARGVVVCRDGYGDHYPVCTLAPREPGKLRINITTRGEVWTRVQILSN
jgi:hypothetical protein